MPKIDVVSGMFSWVDLMSSDAARAREFYGAVFGWTAQEVPMPEGPSYTMFMHGEDAIAGLGQMSDEMTDSGMPSVWCSYIEVADVEESVRKAADLGGTIDVPPMAAGDFGRFAIIQDPTGASVGLWQTAGGPQPGTFNEAGALTWNELVTRDGSAARTFYSGLLGWEWDKMEMPQGAYWVIMNGDRSNGGVMTMTDEWPDEAPAHWMVYIGSDDVDATVELVTTNGGSVQMPPMDIPVGRFAVVADPMGAHFTVFKGGEM